MSDVLPSKPLPFNYVPPPDIARALDEAVAKIPRGQKGKLTLRGIEEGGRIAVEAEVAARFNRRKRQWQFAAELGAVQGVGLRWQAEASVTW